MAKEGVIEVYEKPRTRKGALNRLVENIKIHCPVTQNKKCIISHCKNEEDAKLLKKEIESRYQFKDVIISDMKGLCSYSALEKGIIVSF